MLTGRICLALTVAACVVAMPAAAATRPGSVETRFGGFGGGGAILSVDTAGRDRLVVAGTTDGYPNDHSWVRVFLPDGRPDVTFGGGDGDVELGETLAGDRALALRDGGILVVRPGSYYRGSEAPRITRLNWDGSPDPGFGSGGSIPLDLGGGGYGQFISDVVPDRAGRVIVVGGNITAGATLYVRRYLADGSRDMGFGTNGETVLDRDERSFAAGTVAPDGGLLLTVPRNGYPAVVRLRADGTLDGSFATAPMQLAEPQWRAKVQRIGTGPRPVVLGDGRIRVPLTFDMRNDGKLRIAVVGLTADGRPDRAFGLRGLALGPTPALGGREAADEAVGDATGSVIVAASLSGSEESFLDESGLIRRFRPDGSIDRSFGDRGRVPAALSGGGYIVINQSLVLLDDETLAAGEYSFDGKYQSCCSAALRTLNAGHDRDVPSISLVARCGSLAVRIRDLSGMESVVVAAGRRVIRRTTRKRFRVRVRRGARRVSVRATDLAENSSTRRVRLPRC